MGRVVHFEIHAAQPERAVRFYTELFGWQFRKWDGPIDYWLITTGAAEEKGINGGMVRRRGPDPAEGQPVNAFVCTVSTTTLDEDIQKATACGGSIALPKMPIPGIGWLVFVKDPEGNLLGIMQEDRAAR